MLLSTPTDKDRPVLLLSGSVHYVRSTPEMWPSIFAKLKASGLNAVESCELSSIWLPPLRV
jgi:beta-galactosidase GanA